MWYSKRIKSLLILISNLIYFSCATQTGVLDPNIEQGRNQIASEDYQENQLNDQESFNLEIETRNNDDFGDSDPEENGYEQSATNIPWPGVSPPETWEGPGLIWITSEPEAVGVFDFRGQLLGVTPLALDLEHLRPFALTFMKNGFLLDGAYVDPIGGLEEIHVELRVDDRPRVEE